MTSWHFHPIFSSYVLVALAALALVSLLVLVRPAFATLDRRRQAILVVIRSGVILLVILAMLRPTIVRTQSRPLAAVFAVLIDQSRSMQTANDAGQTRWSALRRTLEDCLPTLEDLSRDMDVRLYRFDSTATPLATLQPPLDLPATPDGDQTDMGTALDDLLRLELGKRLGGVLLMGDGAQRAVAPRADLQETVKEMARRNCPLYTVTFGQSRDQAESRDVAVENIPDHYRVFAKSELIVQGSIRVQGYVNQRIPVEMRIERPDGDVEATGPVMIQAAEDREQVDVRFEYRPLTPGQYKVIVQVPEQPGEQVSNNNQLSAFLDVEEGGLRVLYLCGNVAWQEQKFIRRSLEQSPDIELDFLWTDSRRRHEWPLDLSAQLGNELYDVYLLGDIDAAALGGLQAQILGERVGEGKGLMMLGGCHSFGPGGYGATELARVLPIEIGRFERQDFESPPRRDLHVEGELLLLPTQPHPITRLSAGEDQRSVWEALPPLSGANRFLRPSGEAQPILATPDGTPILVWGQYGLGRVLAFAGDSTFRWYRHGHREEHKRFWRQAVLWLAKKEESQGHELWIRLAQHRILAGAKVPIEVGLQNAQGKAVREADIEVNLVAPDGSKRRISTNPAGEFYRGVSEPVTAAGDYTVEARALKDAAELDTASARFMVLKTDLELTDPASNPQLMQLLASLTGDVGGRAVAPEQLQELLREIRDRPPQSTTEYEAKWQFSDTATDAWAFFLCVVGLLGTDWYLRKRWSLV
jgi:uncharacterized membrane protein